MRYDGATGVATAPKLIDAQSVGHQLFSAVSVDGGVVHVLWWDSRNDPCIRRRVPLGTMRRAWWDRRSMCTRRNRPMAARRGLRRRLTTVASNPNYEQFSNRTVPFAGDYLWVTSKGNFAFGAWTDWQNTVAGADLREAGGSADGADVKQCRTFDPVLKAWSGDQCPHAGGIDQDIYGRVLP